MFVIIIIQADTVLKIYEVRTRCSPVVFSKVLAARKRNVKTARARKTKHSARMLANARKDHSIPLLVSRCNQCCKSLRKLSIQDLFSRREYILLTTFFVNFSLLITKMSSEIIIC